MIKLASEMNVYIYLVVRAMRGKIQCIHLGECGRVILIL